jgi:hypothetical protein
MNKLYTSSRKSKPRCKMHITRRNPRRKSSHARKGIRNVVNARMDTLLGSEIRVQIIAQEIRTVLIRRLFEIAVN